MRLPSRFDKRHATIYVFVDPENSVFLLSQGAGWLLLLLRLLVLGFSWGAAGCWLLLVRVYTRAPDDALD